MPSKGTQRTQVAQAVQETPTAVMRAGAHPRLLAEDGQFVPGGCRG